MKDATALLKTATRRAKSDVANKLVSMFLHELSRKVCQNWKIRVDSADYQELVRLRFQNRCPYCQRPLVTEAVVEHLDGMNRYRAGLHVPGNVLVACKSCNNQKRRDDSAKVPPLAASGWESFLSHDSTRCPPECRTCAYFRSLYPDDDERKATLVASTAAIRAFRCEIDEFAKEVPSVMTKLPDFLTKLYSDCQSFAEGEIRSLLERYTAAP